MDKWEGVPWPNPFLRLRRPRVSLRSSGRPCRGAGVRAALEHQPRSHPFWKSLMKESKRCGAPSSSSVGFQIGILGQRSTTTSMLEPSGVFLFCAPLAILAPFWGWRSLEEISPSSDASFHFFSLFLFFFSYSKGKEWIGRSVGGRGWTATSRVDPSSCDSKSSKRLVFCFLWSTIALGTSEGSWLLLT